MNDNRSSLAARPDAGDSGDPTASLATVSAKYRDELVRSFEAVAFWSAIALPFLHVPLLVDGLDTPPKQVAFAALLVLNVVMLVVGHSHHDRER
ncbi:MULTISPECIES: hypothetical protein [unclassified Haladaptatus]|uniref:hypothetical protein n=1 Tax=unclassified Haladaptatus TaxID=2622732 RepID=UPI0023E774A4|nr:MULTISPECIES: hypothetical protein [unclassified Haladaptatus]